jgi:hypothetical protein
MGCRVMAMGKSGIPNARRSACPRFTKRWLQTTTAGTPRRSNSTASWILHDVQEPQSPRPTIATSAAAASSSRTDLEADTEEVGFWRYMALVISYF